MPTLAWAKKGEEKERKKYEKIIEIIKCNHQE